MQRRTFLCGLALGALSAPQVGEAQQAGKVARLGVLRLGPASANAGRVEALRTSLRERGYVEGKNIVIEYRYAETADQLSKMAAELVRLDVDVIFAISSTEVERVRRTTKTIPIVFATHADPVGLGHVASLARPGGNITGLSSLGPEIVTKALEIMKQALPRMTRGGVMLTLTAPWHRPAADALEAAAPRLGVAVHKVPVQTVEDFDGAFATMERERVGGVLVIGSALTVAHRARLAELALKHRLPSMFTVPENVEAGGLMCYGPDLVDLIRRAATYIDKILKGAKPANLELTRFRGHPIVGTERKVHDAEEPSAVRAGVPAADRRAGP